MKLSPLFGDGMVLQRGQENLFWGYDAPDTFLTIFFSNQNYFVKTDQAGYFQLRLPKMEAGGPYCLEVIGKTRETISDIWFGDVFLLGGQSNMELPIRRTLDLFREEMKHTEEPLIRLFEVPKEYLFEGNREELEGGKWIKAAGEELLDFSALGFFLALELRKTHPVPIGLLQAAVGGTPAKAWCSARSLSQMGLYLEEMKRCSEPETVETTIRQEARRESQWIKEAKEGFQNSRGEERTISIPGLFEGTDLEEFCGSMELKHRIFLTKEQSEKKAYLVFGAMIDADCIRINTRVVGETGYRYPPRRYEIPVGVLHAGENTLEVELLVFRGKGGFIPGKRYVLEWEDSDMECISLEGEWYYCIGRKMEELPETTFFQYMAAGMYQGMIYPLRHYAVRAFLYYQGESNTDSPQGYREQMLCMIKDWRSLWGDKPLPFLYVQLPGFSDAKKPSLGDNWAYLREEQRKVLKKTKQTAMAVIHDVGEYNDLHPQDKKTVGKRLALGVRKLVYGEEVEWSGPLFDRMEKRDGGMMIYFTHSGSGLTSPSDSGFEIAGAEGKFVPAHMKIYENAVFVWSKEVDAPKAVRYGWNNDPSDARLCNKEGLLASPFYESEREEEWQ